VEAAATIWQEFSGVPPQCFATSGAINRNLEIEQPSQEARNVRLNDWGGSIEGEGENGISGVAADSRQTANGIQRLWKPAPMFLHDGLRGRAEVSSSRIIAETLPGVQDLVL
jgi:hypothetical protein